MLYSNKSKQLENNGPLLVCYAMKCILKHLVWVCGPLYCRVYSVDPAIQGDCGPQHSTGGCLAPARTVRQAYVQTVTDATESIIKPHSRV